MGTTRGKSFVIWMILTPSVLEDLKMKGYRSDDLQNERWIYRSRAFLEEDKTVDDIQIELD